MFRDSHISFSLLFFAAQKTEEGEECEAKPVDECEIPDLPNENPILSSLSQDAAEEEEGEEMELMRTASTSQGDTEEKPEVDLSCDSSLMRVLDRLILYLRVVHSVDYYNGTDYPYEDEMPNRCGIIHVRGATPDKCTLSEGTNIQTVFTFFLFVLHVNSLLKVKLRVTGISIQLVLSTELIM